MEPSGENLTKLLHLKTGWFSELFCCAFQTVGCVSHCMSDLCVELVRLFTKTQNRMSMFKDGAVVILLDILYGVLSRCP